MTTHWLMARAEVIEILGAPLTRDHVFQQCHRFLLSVQTPGGARRFVREYVMALKEFLKGRKPNKALMQEFTTTDEAKEIAEGAKRSFEEQVQELAQSNKRRIGVSDVVELLSLTPTAPNTWNLAALDFREKSDTFSKKAFLNQCTWNRPGLRN